MRFGLLGFLAGIEPAGAEAAAILHIVVFGERRDHGGAAFDLADAVQDDFGAAIVHFQGAADLDAASREQADVADVFEIIRKDYDCERTGHCVLAEIQEVNTLVAYLHLQHLSGDAFGFSYVLGGFVDGEAVSGWEWAYEEND